MVLLSSASYAVGTLLLLIACNGLAYGASMSSFRGGPIFPAMFIGAAGGTAMSHLPGLPLVPAVAMGIGAMSVVMLTPRREFTRHEWGGRHGDAGPSRLSPVRFQPGGSCGVIVLLRDPDSRCSPVRGFA
jgi:hypothetical protein